MNSAEYWTKRALLIEEQGFKKSEKYLKSLKEQYDRAIAGVEKDINNWYARFALNNEITFQQASQMLKAKELKELKWDVEEYIAKGRENAIDGAWIKELENASARAHISRLEALKLQMTYHINQLMKRESDGMSGVLSDVYQESYYRQIYDAQQGLGTAFTFARLDADGIEKVLKKPWAADGREFSARIWGTHRAELVNEVHTLLTQATIRGRNPQTLVKDIQKKFDVKRSRAETLCLTEAAHIRAQGQLDGFKASGLDQYEISAALDGRTCQICGAMDGKHFPVGKWQTAVTAPPFHPRCRCATMPWFADFAEGETRIARNEDGKSYTVEDMTYSQWCEKYVDNGGESGIIKSIDIDDFKSMADTKGLAPEVTDVIVSTLQEYERKGGMYISEAKFGGLYDKATGKTALMQVDLNQYDMVILRVNSDFLQGRTLAEVDEQIAGTKSNLAQSLKEAVIHECGHAKAYYRKSRSEIIAMNKAIADMGVDGISKIANMDGAECIAEVEILLYRGENVPESAIKLYNEWTGGKK